MGNFPSAEDIDLNANGVLDFASSVVFQSAPVGVNFQDGNADLLDINADGLPDILHTQVSGSTDHAYYLNQGGSSFAPQALMLNKPGVFLSAAGASLADINGDGVSDLINKPTPETFTLFSNRANGSWAPGTIYSTPMFSNLSDPSVRLMDVDFDKKIDVVRSISGNSWEICRHGSVADQDLAPFDNFPSAEDIDNNANGLFDQGSFSCTGNNPMPFPPPVIFANPDVHLADFNGDRLQDVAWIRLLSGTEAVVWYWPNKGNGQFGSQVTMPIINPTLLNSSDLHLSDANGDGLTDLVKVISGRTTVWFNLGGEQWSAPTSFNSPSYDPVATSIRFADMNGNGSSDILWVQAIGTQRYQYLDFTPSVRPNLLTLIDNGLGRQINIQYKSTSQLANEAAASGNPWSRFSPVTLNVVSRMVVTPGLELDGVVGADQYITDYVYRDPYYDAFEKEFRGFSFVKKIQRGDADAPTLVSRYFFHTGAPDGKDNDGDGKIDERSITGGAEDEPLKGKILKQEITTAAGGADTSIGDGQLASNTVTFTRTTNQWTLRQIYAQTNGTQPQLTLNDSVVSFAYVDQVSSEVIELGVGVQKNLLSTFAFDDFGNQTEARNYGVDGVAGDERFTFTSFINNTLLWNVGLPSEILVTDANAVKITQTRNYYDGADFAGLPLGQVGAGNLMREEKWKDGTTYIQTKRNRYDGFGNVTGFYDAEGVIGVNKHFTELIYDSVFNLFPVSETLHVGDGKPALGMIAEYDVGFGVMLNSTDFNNHVAQYKYDSFGRLTRLVKPGDSLGLPTSSYTYRMADPVRSQLYNYDSDGNLIIQSGLTTASSVETSQREISGVSATLDAIQYVDGLGRELANVQEDVSGWVVNKFTQFNSRGTARDVYQPYKILSSAYSQLNQGSYLTSSRYDSMGRYVEIENPPETAGGVITKIQTIYTPLRKTVLDELNNEKVYINDGLDHLVEVQEVNGIDRYITNYSYNPVDSLTLIKDAQLNKRIFEYDGLQRRTFMNDPNRGLMNWVYDNASNIIETLDAKGQQTVFIYDGVNRVLSEDYLDEGLNFSANVSPDVSYSYDTASAVDQGDGTIATQANAKGRLTSVTDLSGSLMSVPGLPAGEQFHSYDERGRNVWTVKRIPDVQSKTLVSYKTAMDYDSLDRVTDLTYPDGDRIGKGYNNRGLLDNISGGSTGSIVSSIQYKASGQLLHYQYGNGSITDLDYDPRLRMSSLQTDGPTSASLLDYGYTLDGASNVKRIDDNRPVLDVAQGNPDRNTQIFDYDDLYRLKNVQYSYNGPGTTDANDGSIAYTYDKLGNMTSKVSDITHNENGISIPNLGVMTYGGSANGSSGRVGRNIGEAPGPHALTGVAAGTRSYKYDDNGNMLEKNGMQFTWDFKDRLVAIEDSIMRAEYSYDHSNQRVIKHVISKAENARSRPETTIYVDEYYEVREYDQPVKYVFQNGKRIARATENLDPLAGRVQRIRYSTGWNLVTVAIDASDTVLQLGLAFDMDINSVHLWDPKTKSYQALNVFSSIPAGSIVWVESLADKMISIRGSYANSAEPSPVIGGSFVGHANLSYALDLENHIPADVSQAWVFDASQQSWTALLEAPIDSLTDLPESLAPGGVVYVVSETGQVWNTPSPDSVMQYYHQDHIGSVDTITNNIAGVESRNRFYPFGYNRQIGAAMKADPYGFTDKEKDEESNLNYFEARYLGADIGRFVGVDQLLETKERIIDPQRWNGYGYGRNNPVKYIDPDGNQIFAFETGGTNSVDILPTILSSVFSLDKLAGFYIRSPVLPEINLTGTISSIIAVELHMPFNDEGRPFFQMASYSNFEGGIGVGLNAGKAPHNFSPFDGSLTVAGIYGGSESKLEHLKGWSAQDNLSVSYKGRGIYGSIINPDDSEHDLYSGGFFLTTEPTASIELSKTRGYTKMHDWEQIIEGTKDLIFD